MLNDKSIMNVNYGNIIIVTVLGFPGFPGYLGVESQVAYQAKIANQ